MSAPDQASPLPRDLEHEAECWACQNGYHCAWREWGCGRDDHELADECTCADNGWCGESSEAGCCYCVHTDIYEPCPVFGFGCALGAPADWPACSTDDGSECCTPEQIAAARAAPPGGASMTTPNQTSALRVDELEARLRAVRLVCEQMARVADDTEPHPPRPGETYTTGERLDMAEAHAIRRTVAGIVAALNGHGEPRIPASREPDGRPSCPRRGGVSR